MHQAPVKGFPNPVIFDQVSPAPSTVVGLHYYRMVNGVLNYQTPTLSPVAPSVSGIQKWQVNGVRVWHVTPVEVSAAAGGGFGGDRRRRRVIEIDCKDVELLAIAELLFKSGILDDE